MAKKKKFSYKNLVVNEEELAITKIGEMPNPNKSPIFLFIVFGILIIFVFFLPDIVKHIEEKNNVTTNSPVIEKENPVEEIPEKELVYYDLSSTLSVNLEEGIKVNNFITTDNTISFIITNNKSSKFYFSKRNYFLELYTEDKTLLERVILSKDSIASESNKTFTYDILDATATNVKKIVFVEKDIEDYPNVILEKNDASEEILTCVKDYETITYKFQSSKLSSITDIVSYAQTTSDLDYHMNLMKWQERVTTYNNIPGVSSSFISNETGFIVNTVLDLPNVKISSVENENYYAYETLAKVVNFEMEARGFSCN